MCNFPEVAPHKRWSWEWNVGLQTPRLFLLISAASNMEVSARESNGSSPDIREVKTRVCARTHVTFIEDPLISDIWISLQSFSWAHLCDG